jgi:ferredoxin
MPCSSRSPSGSQGNRHPGSAPGAAGRFSRQTRDRRRRLRGRLRRPASACARRRDHAGSVRIDLGRCTLCGDCEPVCPSARLSFDNDVRWPATDRAGLVVSPERPDLDPVRRCRGAAPALWPLAQAALGVGRRLQCLRAGGQCAHQRQLRHRPLWHRHRGLAAPCRRSGAHRPDHAQHGRGLQLVLGRHARAQARDRRGRLCHLGRPVCRLASPGPQLPGALHPRCTCQAARRIR